MEILLPSSQSIAARCYPLLWASNRLNPMQAHELTMPSEEPLVIDALFQSSAIVF